MVDDDVESGRVSPDVEDGQQRAAAAAMGLASCVLKALPVYKYSRFRGQGRWEARTPHTPTLLSLPVLPHLPPCCPVGLPQLYGLGFEFGPPFPPPSPYPSDQVTTLIKLSECLGSV